MQRKTASCAGIHNLRSASHVSFDRILQSLRLCAADTIDLLLVLPLRRDTQATPHMINAMREATACTGVRACTAGLAECQRTKWKDGSARTPWLRISLSAAGQLSPITCASQANVHHPTQVQPACAFWQSSLRARALRKVTALYCSLNSSNLGAIILHGPHHDVE